MDCVCRELGVKPVEPILGPRREQVLAEFIDRGFEAILVNVKANLFGGEGLVRHCDFG